MSYKSLLRNGALLLALSMITLGACKRKDNTTTTTTPGTADDNGGYASDAAMLDRNSNDIISMSDAAVTTGGTNLRTTQTTIGGCATITNDTTVTPHKLTIDFGTSDCTCLDLRKRRGKIVITYSGHYKDSGSTHTITLSNYFVDDIQITGYKTVTNMGLNGLGQYWYNVTVNDSIILGTDSIISWTGNRTRTWLAGYSTGDRSDDVYAIGGTTVLTRANGHVFTHTISATDPLKIALNCPWIESGTVTISSTSFIGGDRVLNYGYGGGGCDDKAQLIIGAHTYVITMH